jgi:hypothetical protein
MIAPQNIACRPNYLVLWKFTGDSGIDTDGSNLPDVYQCSISENGVSEEWDVLDGHDYGMSVKPDKHLVWTTPSHTSCPVTI